MAKRRVIIDNQEAEDLGIRRIRLGGCEHLAYHRMRNGKYICADCDKEFDSFDELVYERHSRVG